MHEGHAAGRTSTQPDNAGATGGEKLYDFNTSSKDHARAYTQFRGNPHETTWATPSSLMYNCRGGNAVIPQGITCSRTPMYHLNSSSPRKESSDTSEVQPAIKRAI